MRQWIDKLREERTLRPEEFRQLLTECDGESLRYINKQAQEVSLRHFGNRIFIRGLIVEITAITAVSGKGIRIWNVIGYPQKIY